MHLYPRILNGGAGGRRLWAGSREFYPKPLFVPNNETQILVRDDDIVRYEDLYNRID